MESFENNEFENEPEVSPESSAQPSRYAANDGAYQTAGTGRRESPYASFLMISITEGLSVLTINANSSPPSLDKVWYS